VGVGLHLSGRADRRIRQSGLEKEVDLSKREVYSLENIKKKKEKRKKKKKKGRVKKKKKKKV